MTRARPTGSTSSDIPAVHAAIAPAGAIHDERRTLYRAAAQLLGVGYHAERLSDVAVVDSPLTRGQIGRGLATGLPIDCAAFTSIGSVVGRDGHVACGRIVLSVASTPDANDRLADALATVGSELARQVGGQSLRLLTERDGQRFSRAMDSVRVGVELAMETSPELAHDLFEHIALIGIIDPDRAGRMVSASSRAFPGLVLLGSCESALEVAEGLVHEAAHQKLFDLAITAVLLTLKSDTCAPFTPSWPPGGRSWQMEQVLAAGHAYACLARFARDLHDPTVLAMAGPSSLLRVAVQRADELGRWLTRHAEWLGHDAHVLLRGLFGGQPSGGPSAPPSEAPSITDCVVDDGLQKWLCESSGKVLVGRRGHPPDLFFLDGEAAILLEIMSKEPTVDIVREFAKRKDTSEAEADLRVSGLVVEMMKMGLVLDHRE